MKADKQVLYFLNGSIGDFFMVLSLFENMHENDASLSLSIVTPRNEQRFRDLSKCYPYVRIIHAHRRNVIPMLGRFIFSRNWCITPPTPGRLPLATKLVARLISLRGRLVGFDDGAWINTLLYSQLLTFDHSKLYYDSLLDILRVFGFERKKESPTLSFEASPAVLRRYGIAAKEYIVLHPFGSASIRSILGAELSRLIRYITETAPGISIVINGSDTDRAHIPTDLGDQVKIVAGEVSMLELATLIQESMFYIGVDTGVTHLAGVIGTRSLVIAHEGAANWLPYYNENATVLYCIRGDSSGTYEGRAYLESHRRGAERYLGRVPHEVIEVYIKKFFSSASHSHL